MTENASDGYCKITDAYAALAANRYTKYFLYVYDCYISFNKIEYYNLLNRLNFLYNKSPNGEFREGYMQREVVLTKKKKSLLLEYFIQQNYASEILSCGNLTIIEMVETDRWMQY